MAYLLRRLPNKEAWADVESSPLWERGDCPPAALSQVYDNRGGVSVWRVETADEVERVVAAQAFMRDTIGDFAYFLINEDDLKNAGIHLKNIPTRTIDKEVDRLHVDIVELSGQQLILLARLINQHFDPIVMTRSEILEAAQRLINEDKFDKNFLFTGGNKGRNEHDILTARNLLVNLWKKGDVGLAGY